MVEWAAGAIRAVCEGKQQIPSIRARTRHRQEANEVSSERRQELAGAVLEQLDHHFRVVQRVVPLHLLDVDLQPLQQLEQPVLTWRNGPERLRQIEPIDKAWRTCTLQERLEFAAPVLLIDQSKVVSDPVVGDHRVGAGAEVTKLLEHLG